MRCMFLAVALLAPASALAQGGATCSTIGNVTNCQHQPSAVLDYGGIMAQAARSVPNLEDDRLSRAQAEALETQSRAEQERINCKRKAMKAIDAGEYEKAKALAGLCP